MDIGRAPDAAIKYTAYLKETQPGIRKVFLFGSYAKGTAHQDSDIDLAIIFESLPDSFDMQVELMKLRRRFDTRIEPHPIQLSDFNTNHPLRNEIIHHGLEIG